MIKPKVNQGIHDWFLKWDSLILEVPEGGLMMMGVMMCRI